MMQSVFGLLLSGLALSRLGWAAPSPLKPLQVRQTENCNTASNRACWISGSFDINTDYEVNTPSTGVVRDYTLTLTEVNNWVGPDGVTKEKVMLVNGDTIGPLIYAQWGDTISVTVVNNMQSNGTSMHWHGVRQLGSNLQDGVNGVTECPIVPGGGTQVYTFVAQQYGTSWYHSHFTAQYGNGIVGPIQIDGPASEPYDIDLGPLLLSDYYYRTADEIVIQVQSGGPPASDNVLFNGTNINPASPSEGKYQNITFTPGKRHRLRLINTSVENHFQVSLVNHSMTIIAGDFVPMNSFTTDSLFVGVGQRYDVTIDASQATDNYWLNVTFGGSGRCGSSNNPHPAAIVHYAGASGDLPTDAGIVPADHQCLDLIDLSPVVARTVPTSGFAATGDNTLDVVSANHKWTVGNSSLVVDWGSPVAQHVLAGETNWTGIAGDNLWQVDDSSEWSYWLIESDPTNANSLPHPIHLHGHDFVVLGRSPDGVASGAPEYLFSASDVASLKGSNPLRRDVTMLPARGWLALAFKTDNPGAWLMHCHIAWHVSGGLGVTFLESPDELRSGTSQGDVDALNAQCVDWNNWYATAPFKQDDSGV